MVWNNEKGNIMAQMTAAELVSKISRWSTNEHGQVNVRCSDGYCFIPDPEPCDAAHEANFTSAEKALSAAKQISECPCRKCESNRYVTPFI